MLILIKLLEVDDFYTFVEFFEATNVDIYTYQILTERVVLKYIHHTTYKSEIKTAIEYQGHTVRNITTKIHTKTKILLNIY